MNARTSTILATHLVEELRSGRDDVSARAAAKIERLRKGTHAAPVKPRVLDLFSGCGGMFLGFDRRGCTSMGGVEKDPLAALSYAKNFHRDPEEHARHVHAIDITAAASTPASVLARWVDGEDHRDAVDIVIGGPPCPAFTRVGRARLNKLRKDDEAFLRDDRAQLYVPYLQYVRALAPVALVMENVPDILNFGGLNVGEGIATLLSHLGYRTAYTLLNAVHYGVPQMRERFFLVGIHESAGVAPRFPVPTHRTDLPPGYESARRVALKLIATDGSTPEDECHFVDPPALPEDARPAVTVAEALRDLPRLTEHLRGLDHRGARRLDSTVHYRAGQPSEYAHAMRNWPGFQAGRSVSAHVTRCLSKRDHRLFSRMLPGDDYPAAIKLAERLFQQVVASRRRGGQFLLAGETDWLDLRKQYVPPYPVETFPNRWRKIEADLPARTLMAHLGKDTYSHIHYDNEQARTITVREAARLQSFPDGFVFAGTMNPGFRQIGNSVPPLLSYALATALVAALGLNLPEREPTPR